MSKILSQVVQKVKENKVAVGVTAVSALALGAFFFFFKKLNSATETQSDQNNQTAVQNNPNESAYLKKARQIASRITYQTLGNSKNYTIDTIYEVLEQSMELAEDEYIQITLKNRIERRAAMESDPATYKQLVFDYNDKIELILKKAQKTILDVLNIQLKDFEESIYIYMENGHSDEMYMFVSSIKYKIKKKIAATKDLTIDQTKEIIKFQIEILKQQPELFKQVMQKLSTSPQTFLFIPEITSHLSSDYIFKEFQVEEEDHMKSMTKPEVASDHEVQLLFQEIDQAMFAFMNSYCPVEGGQ